MKAASPRTARCLPINAYGGGRFTSRSGGGRQCPLGHDAARPRGAERVRQRVSLTYQISHNWQILATYYDSRVGSWTPLTVQSPLTVAARRRRFPSMAERGEFLTLRYQRAAGSHFAPLGGGHRAQAPGKSRASSISMQTTMAASTRARPAQPNVTVDPRRPLLRSDRRRPGASISRWSPTGRHVITVISDNLPLPWTLLNDGRTEGRGLDAQPDRHQRRRAAAALEVLGLVNHAAADHGLQHFHAARSPRRGIFKTLRSSTMRSASLPTSSEPGRRLLMQFV